MEKLYHTLNRNLIHKLLSIFLVCSYFIHLVFPLVFLSTKKMLLSAELFAMMFAIINTWSSQLYTIFMVITLEMATHPPPTLKWPQPRKPS